MLLIVEIEMVWRRSETKLGRSLARSPGLTKVVRPDIVGRRLKESCHCSRIMLLIVEIEMVWRRSEIELGRGLARSHGLTKVVRPDSVGRRLNVSFAESARCLRGQTLMRGAATTESHVLLRPAEYDASCFA
jgi:hypothetical protein